MPRTVPRRRATRSERGRAPRANGRSHPASERHPAEPIQPRQPAPAEPDPVREEVVPGPTVETVAEMRVRVHPDEDEPRSRWLVAAWLTVVLAGVGCLVAALASVGPAYLDRVGAVAVVTAYTWGLAARTGGRAFVFGSLALGLGVAVVLTDEPYLRTGAAVMTCAVAAVLAVMATVPAVRFLRAAVECAVAVLIAAGGALATVGFEPVISLVRFEYATLVAALLGAFAVVYRLGAGLHGLGRRGVTAVLVGGLILMVTLLYAELLRRYAAADVVTQLLDMVRWSRRTLGAFPRPIETLLGIPALAWGCHMRARRRQGWWLCAFGVAATAPVANSLVNPAISLLECGLSVLYGLVVGLVLAYVVIRLDLALTGTRGVGGRRLERARAVRPEPPRTSALL